MGTYTTNRNLYKPSIGEEDWGAKVNSNFDTLDAKATASVLGAVMLASLSDIQNSTTEKVVTSDLIKFFQGSNNNLVGRVDNSESVNSRGSNSIDIQTSRSSASNVASGSNAIALGNNNTASGSNSVALGNSNTASNTDAVSIGNGNTASGDGSAAIGGSSNTASGTDAFVAGGNSNTASKDSAFVHGKNGTSINIVERTFASESHSAYREYVLYGTTSNDTPTTLYISGDSTNGNMIMSDDTTWTFNVMIVGAVLDDEYDGYGGEVYGTIQRNTGASSVHTINTSENQYYASSAGLSAAAQADTTNGGLKIVVTGAAATNINWSAIVRIIEVYGVVGGEEE